MNDEIVDDDDDDVDAAGTDDERCNLMRRLGFRLPTLFLFGALIRSLSAGGRVLVGVDFVILLVDIFSY